MQHTVLKVAISGAVFCATASLVRTAYASTYSVGSGRTYSSLQDLRGRLQPGDIVEIDGNANYPGGVVLDDPGTSQAPITIRGLRVNGKRPVLSGGTNTIEVQADHYVIEGLELTQGSSRCFYHHADDVVLRDSEIHDCPSQGLLGADSDSGSLLMEFVEVHHCGAGTQSHQIYMATDEQAHPGSVFRMQHCYVHDGNGGNNVKSRAERNEIYCNWVEGAMYHELELIGPDDGVGTGGVREDSDVVGNVLLKQATTYVVRFGGDGTGETLGRYRFVNNTVIAQSGGSEVFRLFDGLESLEAHNNVFFALDGGTVSVVRDTEASWTHGRQIAGSNNWVGPTSAKVPTEWTGTLQGSNPGFAALDAWQLTPTTGSPLINAGTSATASSWSYAVPNPRMLPDCVPPMRTVGTAPIARPSDGKIDIGAFEFGATGAGGQPGSGGSPSGTGGNSSVVASGGASAGGTVAIGTGGKAQVSGGTRNSSTTGGSATATGGITQGSGGTRNGVSAGGATTNPGTNGGTKATGGTSSASHSGGVGQLITATGGANGSLGGTGAELGGGSGGSLAAPLGGSESGSGSTSIASESAATPNKEGGCSCRAAGAGTQGANALWSLSITLGLFLSRRRRRSERT